MELKNGLSQKPEPGQVRLLDDGSYFWGIEVEKSYERRAYKTTLICCLVIAVLVLAVGFVFCFMARDFEFFWIVAVCDLVFLAITVAVCWIYDTFSLLSLGVYTMTDDFIKTGSGKSEETIWFKDVRKAMFTHKYIEIKARFHRIRVYVRKEDMDFVRNYVMQRLPGNADIVFDWNEQGLR